MISSSGTSGKRACDICRKRKTKCDGISPRCGPCHIADLQCSYLSPQKKRGPKFRRRPAGINNSQAGRVSAHNDTPLPHSLTRPPAGPSSTSIRHLEDPVYTSPSTYCRSRASVDIALSSMLQTMSAIHDRLLLAFGRTVAFPLEAFVSKCIDLYMQHLFPLMPLVHEPNLRAHSNLLPLALTIPAPSPASEGSTQVTNPFSRDEVHVHACTYALLTAVCAETASVLPEELFGGGSELAATFLHASRDMLHLVQDMDIECPSSTSIVTRYFQSNCIHAAGKTRVSWHILCDAIHLAQDMRLHDETSLQGLEPIEAHLRRNIFWQLYTGDKSAAILNNRPFTMHVFGFDGEISICHTPENVALLLNTVDNQDVHTLETQVNVGFNICQKLWSSASNILFELKYIQHHSSGRHPTDVQMSKLTNAYVSFVSILDHLPEWLLRPDNTLLVSDGTREQHRRYFWAQRINLQISFYCMRLIILQRFAHCGLSAVLGFSDSQTTLALHKTEIAYDMLAAIHDAPFEAMQVNGEPCVEKIRQVGASLLEVVQTSDNQQIIARGKSAFMALLDVLTRLDSRASDTLHANLSSIQ